MVRTTQIEESLPPVAVLPILTVAERRALIAGLRRSFRLDWRGIHGIGHWIRVRRTGLLLARHAGADPLVVELFALLHDACRHDDRRDLRHGPRAALLLDACCDEGLLVVTPEQRRDLREALAEHSTGSATGRSVTVMVCFDADRLDLARLKIRPDPARLGTATAQDPRVIAWAWAQAHGLRADWPLPLPGPQRVDGMPEWCLQEATAAPRAHPQGDLQTVIQLFDLASSQGAAAMPLAQALRQLWTRFEQSGVTIAPDLTHGRPAWWLDADGFRRHLNRMLRHQRDPDMRAAIARAIASVPAQLPRPPGDLRPRLP
jgi:uncharacterized protein